MFKRRTARLRWRRKRISRLFSATSRLVGLKLKIRNRRVKTLLMAFFIAATLSACVAAVQRRAGGHHAIPTPTPEASYPNPSLLLLGATTLHDAARLRQSSFPCCKRWTVRAGLIKYGSASSINPRLTRLTQAIVSFMLRRGSCAGPTTINSAAPWPMKSPTKISVMSPKRKSSAPGLNILAAGLQQLFPAAGRWRPLLASWSCADMDAPKSLPPTAMASISSARRLFKYTLVDALTWIRKVSGDSWRWVSFDSPWIWMTASPPFSGALTG